MTDEERRLTMHHMCGEWSCEEHEMSIHLYIGCIWKEVTLTINGGKPINFKTGGHWFANDSIYRFDNTSYFITSANDEKMGFGKLTIADVLDAPEWMYVLNRIK